MVYYLKQVGKIANANLEKGIKGISILKFLSTLLCPINLLQK